MTRNVLCMCRNVYRGTPKMFALDSVATKKAEALIVSYAGPVDPNFASYTY